MADNKRGFTELAKAKIQDKRNIVISRNENVGGYTLAQQISIEEGRKVTSIFIKGAFHIDALCGLYELRDACNEAIKKEESKTEK
jgi:hypothetical protein